MSVHDVKIPINRDGSEETASLMGAFKYAVSYMANRYNETVKGEDFHGLSGFLIHYKSFPYRGFCEQNINYSRPNVPLQVFMQCMYFF